MPKPSKKLHVNPGLTTIGIPLGIAAISFAIGNIVPSPFMDVCAMICFLSLVVAVLCSIGVVIAIVTDKTSGLTPVTKTAAAVRANGAAKEKAPSSVNQGIPTDSRSTQAATTQSNDAQIPNSPKTTVKRITGSNEYYYKPIVNGYYTKIFPTLQDEGFELTSFQLTELHDMFEEYERYCCNSLEELLSDCPSIHGNWAAQGRYNGAEVWLTEASYGEPADGVRINFAAEDAERVKPLIEAFDKEFAPNRIEVEDGILTKCVGNCPRVHVFARSIAPGAFCNNITVRIVNIDKCCQEIGACAFDGCSNLEYLMIPESVETVGVLAFGNCGKLVTAGPIAKDLCAAWETRSDFRPREWFTHNFEFGHKTALPAGLCNHMQLTQIELPSTLTSIGNHCFSDCKKLRELTIPDRVTDIGRHAFENTRLRKLELPASLAYAGEGAFSTHPGTLADPSDAAQTNVVVDNKSPFDETVFYGQSFAVELLGRLGITRKGSLWIGSGSFTFEAESNKKGYPSLRGGYSRPDDSLAIENDVLTITSKGTAHRFRLSKHDLESAAHLAFRTEELRRRVAAPYACTIADDCAKYSWPNVHHPFFQRHATGQTDVRAIMEFLADDNDLRRIVFVPLPWFSQSVSIQSYKHALTVSFGQGAEHYYDEAENSISLRYYTHQVGFFDDSEYEKDVLHTLEYVEHPSDDMMDAVVDPDEVRSSQAYLKNPFGMTGIFCFTKNDDV